MMLFNHNREHYLMTIRVLSFDFDGCLFNRAYIDSHDVIQANYDFLEKIKAENAHFDDVYTFIGSNRQSKPIDIVNSHSGKGSCFPAIALVNKHLGAKFDSFLLADVYADLPEGTAYARAMDSEYNGSHSDWLFDDTKATLIYAQIQKMANAHPHEDIVFDFYDDRGNGLRTTNDILEKLNRLYSQYPDLIPANVTLRLNHYAGDNVTPLASIKGTGFIDCNYQQTVKDMAAQAMTKGQDGIFSLLFVADHLKPSLLTNRKELSIPIASGTRIEDLEAPIDQRTPEATAVPAMLWEKEAQASQKFSVALQAIEDKAASLQEKAKSLYDAKRAKQTPLYYRYIDASSAANELHVALKWSFENDSQENFKNKATIAINDARHSELKYHRGWKEVFALAALAVLAVCSVATLGLAYAVAGGINYAVNRQFFFSTTIKTDSIEKVDEIQDVVKAIAAPAS